MDKLVSDACVLGPAFFLSACDSILEKKTAVKSPAAKIQNCTIAQKKVELKKQKL